MLSLNLINCENCKALPSIGQLPLFKDLLIEGMTLQLRERWCFSKKYDFKELKYREIDFIIYLVYMKKVLIKIL